MFRFTTTDSLFADTERDHKGDKKKEKATKTKKDKESDDNDKKGKEGGKKPKDKSKKDTDVVPNESKIEKCKKCFSNCYERIVTYCKARNV